jgi:hypothetical protein|tara:strand:+ start:459 stop:767 length:309 start_codon:yes stop_codon:yes gene_type:complete
MKVKELIIELEKIENQDKYIHLLGNRGNAEDEDLDIIFDNVEIWDDGDESITLFLGVEAKDKIEEQEYTNIIGGVDFTDSLKQLSLITLKHENNGIRGNTKR